MEKVLIAHHWDADGITSAVLLKKTLLKDVEASFYTPPIGEYRLEDHVLRQGFSKVYVLDLALPEHEFIKVLSTGVALEVYDHHKWSPSSKLAEAKILVDPSQPSTSWLLAVHLNVEKGCLAALGAVGDNGVNIKRHPLFSEISSALKSCGLSFKEALQLAELLDMPYRVMNRSMVISTVQKVLQSSDLRDLLRDEELCKIRDALSAEINRVLSQPLDILAEGNIALLRFSSSYAISSAVGRQLAWMHRPAKVVVVINEGFFPDRDQYYIRLSENGIDLSPLIAEAKAKGWSAGGKREVAGIVVPKAESQQYLAHILKKLEEMLSGGVGK